MKKALIKQIQKWALLFCLLFPCLCRAEQFVQLTAKIEFTNQSGKAPDSILARNWTIHCVVGKNSWFMEYTAGGWTNRCWFTGTNLGTQNLSSKDENYSNVYKSVDGNPYRSMHASEILGDLQKIAWLAFCSSPTLKHDDHQIPLPDDFWKKTDPARFGFSDRTTLFEDSLGLPKSVEVFTKDNPGQRMFRYRVRQSTNVLDWNFPLEFDLAQYNPASTNGTDLYLAAKGRITAIGPATKPVLPPADAHPYSKDHYTLATISGGIVSLTNAPNSTPVHIAFTGWDDNSPLGHAAVFRLTNDEARSILIWNYRVQVRLPGDGTNAPDWETVSDDFPSTGQISHMNTGTAEKILVAVPDRTPWRACILYSKGTAAGEQPGTYDGDYEVISQEMQK